MKILFVCSSPNWGGAEKYVVAVAAAMGRRGHRCVVATGAGSPLHEAVSALECIVVETVELGPKLSARTKLDTVVRGATYRSRLSELLRRCRAAHGVQLVHLQFKKEQLLGTGLATAMGLRVVWTEHGWLPRAFSRSAPALAWYRRMAAHATRVLCVSSSVREDLLAHGLPPEQLVVRYNGIDAGPPPDAADRATARRSLGVGSDELIVAAVSRLVRTKGLQHLLEAAPQVVRRAPDIRFVIAGSGPERGVLEAQARAAGVADHVRFLGHRDDVASLLPAFDVLVAPSLEDGLGYSALEAMAAGLPVIASEVGGLVEVVASGETGTLVPAGDADALSAAIVGLARDPARRADYGAAGRDRVIERFTLNAMMAGTEAVFLEACATSQKEPWAEPPGVPQRPPEARVGSAFAKMFAGGVAGKLLGVVREVALAASFGTGATAGAFRAAQTATLIPTHFFSSDTLNAGFIPMYARALRQRPARAHALFWSVFMLLTVVSVAVAAALWFYAPVWARMLVPGFSSDTLEVTAGMIRAMAVGVPFYMQASLFAYVEMARGDYLIGSLRSSVQNLGLLIGIAAAFATGQPLLVGWGFTAYSVLLAAIGLGSVLRKGYLGRPAHWLGPETRAVAVEFTRLTRPLVLLPVVHQGSLAVERIVASLIRPDVVASLDYAKTISETGVVLLAVPLGLAGLAELSRVDADVVRDRLQQMLPLLLLIMVPVSVFIGVNSQSIVRVVFARGRFGDDAVATTSLILAGLAVGFWAHVAGHVMMKVLSARGRNREAVLNVAAAACFSIAINLAMYRTLGPIALGLAASASGIALLGLTARSLGLLDTLARQIAPLLAGVALYLPLAWSVNGASTGGSANVMQLAFAAASCALFWLVWIAFVPALRRTVAEPALTLMRRTSAR